MTLALYGKSRKRRAGLLFTAFMAIMVAAIGGVSLIGTAFAHYSGLTGVATCNQDGTWSIAWGGVSNTENTNRINISIVSITSPLSDPTFSPNPVLGKNEAGYTEATATSSNISSSLSSVTLVIHVDWQNDNGSDTNLSKTVSRPTACTPPPSVPKLKVVKDVVDYQGNDITDSQNFSFAINRISENETGVSPTSFQLDDDNDATLSNQQVVTLPGVTSGSDWYEIDETNIPNGWSLDDITCTGQLETNDPDTGDGDIEVKVNNTSDVTCTFTNKKDPPPTRLLRICKDVDDNGQAPNNEGGQFSFTVTGGASTTVNLTSHEDDNDGTLDGQIPCQNIAVTEGVATTISESGLPAGWNHATGFPHIDVVPAANQPANGSTTAIVTVKDDSCDNGTTTNGLIGFFQFAGADCVVIFRNVKSTTPPPSVSVDKSDNTQDGTADLGSSFNFTLKFTVTNGPTVSAYSVQDQVPANFTVGTISPDGNGSPLHCTNSGNLVSCTLDAGATTNYTATIPVTVKNDSQCGAVVNTVYKDSTTSGQPLDNDTVNITGCGTISYDKLDGVRVGDTVQWTIKFTNTSAVQQLLTVHDDGTTLVSESCVNDNVADNPGSDDYTCTVAAYGTANVVVSTPLTSEEDGVCSDVSKSNTAWIPGSQNSDTAEFSETAQPDSSCFVITKEASDTDQNGSYTFWDISVTNNTDATQEVHIVDSGAVFIGVTNGTCPGVISDDDMSGGIVCSVASGQTMVVHVGKAKNLNVCEGSNTNSATIHLGRTADGTPLLGTPDGGSINYRNEDQCSSVIQLCKVWAFDADNELSDGDANFDFTVNDDPFTIFGVTEGDSEPECILLDVPNGGVSISEDLTAGFHALGWEIDHQAAEGLGDSVSFTLTPNGCYTLQNESVISLYVRQVLNVVGVAEIEQGEPVCTITFTNYDDQNREPSGNLRIEKYLDINGDGDANDAGEGLLAWTVNVQGPEAGVVGDHFMAGGFIDFAGLTYGDVYTATEASQAGYTVTNATVDGVSKGAVTSTNATIPNGGTTVIRFYNQPLGGITVHKDTYNVVNNIESQNFNDDDGWKITVDSATCNIHLSKNTDSNGNATFSGLPLCTDYVVKEDLNNPGAPGYSPVTPATVTGVTPTINGNTQVNFVNQTKSTDPVCTIGCTPRTTTPTTPTTPPSTPTTPPTTTVTPPTNTPTTPASPSETAIAGEKTPGPGNPTPIAPSTGSGLMGGTAAGMNLLLLLGGILALASGLSFVALGRKSRS